MIPGSKKISLKNEKIFGKQLSFIDRMSSKNAFYTASIIKFRNNELQYKRL